MILNFWLSSSYDWTTDSSDLTVSWDEFIGSFLSSAGNSSPSDASYRSLDWLLDTLVRLRYARFNILKVLAYGIQRGPYTTCDYFVL